jgi:hypothetical protein
MDLLINSPISWIIFIGIMLFLTFSMGKIKQEKLEYLDEATNYQLAELTIPIANWWTQVSEEPNELLFKRTDTHYDWYARFSVHQTASTLNELLDQILQEQKLQFDQEVIIETDARYLIVDNVVQNNIEQLIKAEGTASKDEIERIYLDLILIRSKSGKVYVFESTASVLNGGVEGPYFEEAIKNIKFIN